MKLPIINNEETINKIFIAESYLTSGISVCFFVYSSCFPRIPSEYFPLQFLNIYHLEIIEPNFVLFNSNFVQCKRMCFSTHFLSSRGHFLESLFLLYFILHPLLYLPFLSKSLYYCYVSRYLSFIFPTSNNTSIAFCLIFYRTALHRFVSSVLVLYVFLILYSLVA